MAGFLGFLHDYTEGGLIDSSDWNDELNQILAVLGSAIVANPNKEISLQDLTSGVDNPVLKLENLLTGNLLELINAAGTASSFIRNNGQIDLGANAVVGLIVASAVKCPNLNADLLDGNHSTAFETKLYSAHSFTAFWPNNFGDDFKVFIPKEAIIITKLKLQQQGVASADAQTIISFRRNGINLGTVTINGNTTAVQTNDIGDVNCSENDILDFTLSTYNGGTKHTNITASIEYKNKYST